MSRSDATGRYDDAESIGVVMPIVMLMFAHDHASNLPVPKSDTVAIKILPYDDVVIERVVWSVSKVTLVICEEYRALSRKRTVKFRRL